jgi:hypothetical protein
LRTTVASADIGDISELLQFGLGLLAASFGMPARLDLLLHLFQVGAFVAFAQLLLDRLDLLVQVVLALALLHLALHAAADALLDLQDVEFGLELLSRCSRRFAHVGRSRALPASARA